MFKPLSQAKPWGGLHPKSQELVQECVPETVSFMKCQLCSNLKDLFGKKEYRPLR